MIKTKFCDFCGGEFPPACFPPYRAADFPLHPDHPWKIHDSLRLYADPKFTTGANGASPDVCLKCLANLVMGLHDRVARIAAKEWAKLEAMKQPGVRMPSDADTRKAHPNAKFSKL